MKTISPASLAELISKHPDVALIDVRTPLEFDEVHVKQAQNLPLDSFSASTLIDGGKLPADQPVYILCRSGQRATKAAKQFSDAGYEIAVVVEGGTLAWIEAHLPVERGVVKTISLERQVRIGAGTLVLTGVVLGTVLHPAFYGLSGFVGAGLIFAGITDWCGMGLLIAKAPWNQRAAA